MTKAQDRQCKAMGSTSAPKPTCVGSWMTRLTRTRILVHTAVWVPETTLCFWWQLALIRAVTLCRPLCYAGEHPDAGGTREPKATTVHCNPTELHGMVTSRDLGTTPRLVWQAAKNTQLQLPAPPLMTVVLDQILTLNTFWSHIWVP